MTMALRPVATRSVQANSYSNWFNVQDAKDYVRSCNFLNFYNLWRMCETCCAPPPVRRCLTPRAPAWPAGHVYAAAQRRLPRLFRCRRPWPALDRPADVWGAPPCRSRPNSCPPNPRGDGCQCPCHHCSRRCFWWASAASSPHFCQAESGTIQYLQWFDLGFRVSGLVYTFYSSPMFLFLIYPISRVLIRLALSDFVDSHSFKSYLWWSNPAKMGSKVAISGLLLQELEEWRFGLYIWEERCTRGATGDKDPVGDEWRKDVMVYTMVYTYIYIIQYTMIYTNDIYRGMSCITYGI